MAQNKLEIALPKEHQPGPLQIDAYVDAGMGNPNEVHGTTGWFITVNGYPVAWKSKKQARVGRSSAKVELNAMHDLADYLVLMTNVYQELNVECTVNVYSDSNDVVNIIHKRHPKLAEKVDIYVLRELQTLFSTVPAVAMVDTVKQIKGKVKVSHIAGDANPADALTKAAGAASHEVLRRHVTLKQSQSATVGEGG